MRNFLGIIMILSGAVLGVYVGLWICLVGGIVDIVNGFNHGNFGESLWGCLKFVFAGMAGYLSAFLLVGPGLLMLED